MLKIIEEIAKCEIDFKINRRCDIIRLPNEVIIRFDRKFGKLKLLEFKNGNTVIFAKDLFIDYSCKNLWVIKVYGERDLICEMMFPKEAIYV